VTGDRIDPALEGVPETMLWTLYHRAVEARRPDAILHDPVAVELVERIDYPFAERFGPGSFARWQALRVRAFDREVQRFMAARPGGTVVALGEGLETELQRVDDGRVRWVGVDLPETVAIRRRLLPDPPRRTTIAASALDVDAWAGAVDASGGVLLTAQGLLMYLDPPDVHRLIAACAARFPGAALVFDAVPRWLASLNRAAAERSAPGAYRAPPWTWTFDRAEARRIAALPGVAHLRPRSLPRGSDVLHGFVLPLATRTPGIRTALLSVHVAVFRTP